VTDKEAEVGQSKEKGKEASGSKPKKKRGRPLMSKTASARFYRSSKNRVSFRQGVMNLINF